MCRIIKMKPYFKKTFFPLKETLGPGNLQNAIARCLILATNFI
jgi:hypothetical protein